VANSHPESSEPKAAYQKPVTAAKKHEYEMGSCLHIALV